MAENENILSRLGRLFQSNIIIRKRDDDKLVVKDLDFAQSALVSNFVDRYSKIMGRGSWGVCHLSSCCMGRGARSLLLWGV